MIFGRNRNVKTETVILPEELQDPRDRDREGSGPSGPFDVSERPGLEGYIDLGTLRVPAVAQLKLRLDVEKSTNRIIGVTLSLGESSLQVQAFAAPRSGGLWEEIRAELLTSLAATKDAKFGERAGRFGTEVQAQIPASMPDGSPGRRAARFFGVDGPRWFLRGVIGGEAAIKDESAGPLNEVFSRIVVRRGEDPHPPRELLALTPPENLRPVRRPEADPARPASQRPPERGPEITEVR